MSTSTLIKNLQNTKLYSHAVKQFKVIETHISWVILTGDFVYKIKKPVDFGFLNFTSLADRKFYCELELKLNQIAAAELYLEIITITGSEENPQLNGEGQPIEYALKMREFPQELIFANLLKQNRLTSQNFVDLAKVIADFHQRINKTPPNDFFGTPEQIYEPVKQNFDQIHELLNYPQDRDHLANLATWAEQQYKHLYPIFQARKQQQYVRECHGDIHLMNTVLLNGQPKIFDCLEFNDSFRWTDTMADIGFMIMDLQYNDRFDLANTLLNHYLIHSNDYAGLKVLLFYQAYRTMVRAKVKLLEKMHADNQAEYDQLYQRYIKLADYYAKPRQPILIITHGISGTGKPTVARELSTKLEMIQLSSDIMRKRVAGIELAINMQDTVDEGIYTAEWTNKTYAQLLKTTEEILAANYSVVVDATFLKKNQREKFSEFAKQNQIPFYIFSCQLPEKEIFARIHSRQMKQNDPSEAHIDVAKMQLQNQDELTEEEKKMTIFLDTHYSETINNSINSFIQAKIEIG